MDIFPSSFLPGDPRLIDQIVYELKSQGIFDQFRKECISDVDTKPAYQNLSQWVEGSVMNFLNQLKFASDTNKNQLREQLRKNITESGYLEVGVERIVDQAVNPKITSVFLPKVEDVVYRFLGIQKPEAKESIEESKPKTEDLLPIDLEAVSPESVLGNSMNSSTEKKEENVVADTHKENDNSLNNSESKPDDESPAFEPLHDNDKFLLQEENSIESNGSNISAAATINSTKNNEIDLSEPRDTSQGISESNMKQSVAIPEEDLKMDVCENTMTSECSDKLEIVEEKTEAGEEKASIEGSFPTDISALTKKCDSKKSHDKHKSSRSDKSKRDERDRSKSESKSKDSRDKTKYSSSSKDKDKRDQLNGKEMNQDKDKSSKKESKDRDKNRDDKSNKETKEKLEKVKDRSDKERNSGKDRSKSESEKQKEKSKWDKDRTNDKDKSSSQKSKEKSSRSSRKDDAARDKSRRKDDKKDKDEKSSKDKSSSSRDKDRPSSHKDSINTSKGKIKSNSSSSKDKERRDSKSRNDKHSSNDKDRSSSAKKEKEKDKVAIDDHYSFKKKISERRSTDRDSNDGSSKMSKSGRFMESFSSNPSKSEGSKSSECFSSESGDSGNNTDNVEKRKHGEHVDNADLGSPIKYIKPKFASNIQEAMRIMKIRKQLAKLERQNQLSLSHVPINQAYLNQSSPSTPLSENSEDQLNSLHSSESSVLEATLQRNIQQAEAVEDIPTLKSQVLSMESFQALEARLAQEMSNIDEHMYGEEDESFEYPSIKSNPVKKRKLTEENLNDVEKLVPQSLENVDLKENEPLKRTEESDQTKFKGFAMADRNHVVVEKLQVEIDILLQGVNDKIAQLAQMRSQEVKVTAIDKYNIPENDVNNKCVLPCTKHKNGEKLIIKICKIEEESCTPKELNQCNQERRISFVKGIEKDVVANTLNKSVLEETKVKHNGQVIADKVVNNQERGIPNWETDEVPCRFFDKTSTLVSTAHLKILNREIVGLEASIEDESLKIQNNVPKLRKQGAKRKAGSSENNNRITCEYKPPTKQKLLSDANANQTNKSKVYNTNVSSHQDFLLPLSPAESVKSGEHKKEEPVMVKPKRDSANKRYSSEDLYKPRPVLSCTSRRRSDRFGDVGKS